MSVCYGQVKGRKYPSNQPVPIGGRLVAPLIDEKPKPSFTDPIIVDERIICDSVYEAASVADVKPCEVTRVLKGDRKSVSGHTFRMLRYANGGER